MMLEGRFPAVPNMGFGVVDVRDVARAHVLALEAPAEKVPSLMGRYDIVKTPIRPARP